MIGNNFKSNIVSGPNKEYMLSGKDCNMALCLATL